tara:strand:- start:331 stop:957 length:627 start_codon:yes stop_codon:yes gene_type:complete
MSIEKIIVESTKYYEKKLEIHGPSHSGVDWSSEASQKLRFKQLMNVVEPQDDDFTLIDYGCGYGALLDYLSNQPKINYIGFDSSEKMIKEAKKVFQKEKATWLYDFDKIPISDYLIASGIFNVKLNFSNRLWLDYIFQSIEKFDKLTTKGFAFNVLTTYSDESKMKENLYYADPIQLFEYCKKNISNFVMLRHDYPLYEFTLIIRKGL